MNQKPLEPEDRVYLTKHRFIDSLLTILVGAAIVVLFTILIINKIQ